LSTLFHRFWTIVTADFLGSEPGTKPRTKPMEDPVYWDAARVRGQISVMGMTPLPLG